MVKITNWDDYSLNKLTKLLAESIEIYLELRERGYHKEKAKEVAVRETILYFQRHPEKFSERV